MSEHTVEHHVTARERVGRDLHSAPPIVWVAVSFMLVGVVLCAFSLTGNILWLGIAGGSVAVVGGILALAGDIMGQAH